MWRLLSCLPAFALALTLSGISGTAGGATYVHGTVYEDANLNGTRDPEEDPVLWNEVIVRDSTSHEIIATDSGYQAEYSIPLTPGTYTIESDELVIMPGICVDSFGGFNPQRLDDCIQPLVQWVPTSPSPVMFSLAQGESAQIDFGLRPLDAIVVAGVAIEQDHHANGDDVVAYINGVECGRGRDTGTPFFNGIHNFEITVLADSERAGCGKEGDTITFEINGIPAAETVPFEVPDWQFWLESLTASEDYAWFWTEQQIGVTKPEGTIEAWVDGKVCGQTEIVTTSKVFTQIVGFGKLIVPSAAVEPGCGETGKVVRFTVNGIDLGEEIPWEPGVHQFSAGLVVPVVRGDADCSGTTTPVDAVFVLRYDAWFRPVPCFHRADLDCDADLTPIDALLILRLDAALNVAVC